MSEMDDPYQKPLFHGSICVKLMTDPFLSSSLETSPKHSHEYRSQ
jgi:hypothetical protein